jgi:hypothetical protein
MYLTIYKKKLVTAAKIVRISLDVLLIKHPNFEGIMLQQKIRDTKLIFLDH